MNEKLIKSCTSLDNYFDIKVGDTIYYNPKDDIECKEKPITHPTIHKCVLAGSSKIHYMFTSEVTYID